MEWLLVFPWIERDFIWLTEQVQMFHLKQKKTNSEDYVIRLITPISRKKFHIPQRASQGSRSTEDDRVYYLQGF
jgi:hypothetical protein